MSVQNEFASIIMAENDSQRLEATIAGCEAELASISRDAGSRRQALTGLKLGEALSDLADLQQDDPPRARALRARARQTLEAALQGSTELASVDRAMLQVQLGRLLRINTRTRERAIRLFRMVIDGIRREEEPELWGTAQFHLAEALLGSPQLDDAMTAAHAAVTALRSPRLAGQARLTLVRALTEAGTKRTDLELLDQAVALGRAAAARHDPEAGITYMATAYSALGHAALARARLTPAKTACQAEAVRALRTALTLTYDETGSFSNLDCSALGCALLLAPDCRARLAEDMSRVETGSTKSDRLISAIDVLAVGSVLTLKDQSAAWDLFDALKVLADRLQDTSMWEAWTRGITALLFGLKDPELKARRYQELKTCVHAHGTPDMRLAWARAVSPSFDSRALSGQIEVLEEIRALADRYPEPRLRRAWAQGVYVYCFNARTEDVAAVSRMLGRLETYALEAGDPAIWRSWAQSVCALLQLREYSEDNLDRARGQLSEALCHLPAGSDTGWPKAAKTIHDILLDRDHVAAGQLRDEIKAAAETAGDDEAAWSAWLEAAVGAIKVIRMTDYAAARALFAEIQAVASGPRAYDRKQAIAEARGLLQDREVKRAHGLIGEVLEPVTLTAEATSTGDGLRVSRLDASAAPKLKTVGSNIYCHDMILTGTAITNLPDDLQVKQRLDVSQCRLLKRLPPGLTVGQLLARECTALETLPAGLRVSYLDLTGCLSLKALPADLMIRHGRLSLAGCERLTSLPRYIGQIAQLDISGCLNISDIPTGLVVTAWLDVGGSGLRALPPHLEGIGIRWRGVPIDARIAFQPQTLEVREILAEANAERRRVMMERFGLDHFMAQAKAQVLDQDRDAGGPRRLLRVDLAGDEPLVCVSVICPSTSHQFMLRVPPTMKSCRQAIAWTAGFDKPDEYQPDIET